MPHPTVAACVKHPETGLFVGLNPAIDYPVEDALVVAYPWAFVPREVAEAPESVVIEKASAEPGAKRGLFRRS